MNCTIGTTHRGCSRRQQPHPARPKRASGRQNHPRSRQPSQLATGPVGATATEAQAVKTIVEQGGKAAVATKATIGAATNVISDVTPKVLTNQDVTTGDVTAKGFAGAATSLLPAKSTLVQSISGEAINSAADAIKDAINSSVRGDEK
jgi:hypothetical protein